MLISTTTITTHMVGMRVYFLSQTYFNVLSDTNLLVETSFKGCDKIDLRAHI